MIHNGNFSVHTRKLEQDLLNNPDWRLHLPGHNFAIRDTGAPADRVFNVDYRFERLNIEFCDLLKRQVKLEGDIIPKSAPEGYCTSRLAIARIVDRFFRFKPGYGSDCQSLTANGCSLSATGRAA